MTRCELHPIWIGNRFWPPERWPGVTCFHGRRVAKEGRKSTPAFLGCGRDGDPKELPPGRGRDFSALPLLVGYREVLKTQQQERLESHIWFRGDPWVTVEDCSATFDCHVLLVECETAGKCGKRIGRSLIASFRIVESMGFKGELRQWAQPPPDQRLIGLHASDRNLSDGSKRHYTGRPKGESCLI